MTPADTPVAVAHSLPDSFFTPLIAAGQKDLPPPMRESFERFARALYRHTSQLDVEGETTGRHLQRLTGLWAWAMTYPPSPSSSSSHAPASDPGRDPDRTADAKVRVSTPPASGEGWRQGGTFIDIISVDRPFLVDSVTTALARLGVGVTLVQHPVFQVVRTSEGVLERIDPHPTGQGGRESWIHLTLERQPAEKLEAIRALLLKVLADVRLAVTDWQDMRAALTRSVAALPQEIPPGQTAGDTSGEVDEVARFCRWLDEDHFLFLGYRDYTLSPDGRRLEPDLGAARGLLRDSDLIVLRGLQAFDTLPDAVQAYIREPSPLFVNKAQARSSVHRAAPYDLIGIRRFGPDGQFTGLRLFLGLFTSLAYSTLAQDVPWLSGKVARILARSGCDPRGHNGKALIHILNTYPRDDIFLIDEDSLFAICQGILMLADRIRTALFVWTDPFRRFTSCLIYTPRDRFDTDLRKTFIGFLEGALDGTCTGFSIDLSDDSPLVRLRVVIARGVTTGRTAVGSPALDIPALERRLADIARGWDDRVADLLIATHGTEEGLSLRARYAEAFGSLYRGLVTPERAASDIALIETALRERPLALTLDPVTEQPSRMTVRLFQREVAPILSDVVPRLENMGLRILSEVPYRVTPRAGATVWISELLVETRTGDPVDVAAARSRFQEAFLRLWDGSLVDDPLNRLILSPGLVWREVALLRAYARYLQQVGFALSYGFLCDTLAAHPEVTARLVRLFHTLFDPDGSEGSATREEKAEGERKEIEALLATIRNPSEDEVLRRYLNLITCTLRTNFYQKERESGAPAPYLSFKLDSGRITDLPPPRPWVEIWVYSPRVEGIHLRGGPVARGGLRWSDRPDDFRTEVLGLLKAQMVKNAVIVPVGSKGGFYCKALPTDRTAQQKEVVACYQTFIRGLLDLTDNRVNGKIIPPPLTVRRDGNDPYLVVAADKGTAKFSDMANSLSRSYGFWLGDAFASGGSAGYDHKGMGITARGAWESVKRHFRERGRNIQMEPFTCVGIGDMAGDVFGNGLLRSPVTLLVGAFNHAHIFLDPNPDPALSFTERKRLFDLPGSQWSDYDPAKLSKGGGVYERAAKSIPLSPEVRARFGLTGETITPPELIRALLTAPVDLLYLGGIGTYVKASDETHAEVSDKANDSVRVNAADLRALVVGEGANLGFTARARIEFARQGGALNSDAIDNSGGVDTSDHEVNLKIALQPDIARKTLTEEERNRVLAGMTEEVAALVLKDNYLQPQALSLEHRQAPALLGAHARLIQMWEKAGRLDRGVERLPDEAKIAQRAKAGEGLTRPELALLLAHAKLALSDALLHSTLPEDPVLEADLFAYFPTLMQTRFPEAIRQHQLRREITATVLANEVVNRMGPAFAHSLSERTGHSTVDILRAYLVVRRVFDLPHLWRGVEALDHKIPADLQLDLLARTQAFVARTISALLQMAPRPLDITALEDSLGPRLASLAQEGPAILPDALKASLRQSRHDLLQQGVPEELAARFSLMDFLASGPDILVVARMAGQEPEQAAAAYYAVGERFGLEGLRAQARSLQTTNNWQRQEALALAEDLFAAQQKLALKVLAQAGGDVGAWVSASPNADAVKRYDALLGDIRTAPHFDLSMLAVAGRSLRNLAGP